MPAPSPCQRCPSVPMGFSSGHSGYFQYWSGIFAAYVGNALKVSRYPYPLTQCQGTACVEELLECQVCANRPVNYAV